VVAGAPRLDPPSSREGLPWGGGGGVSPVGPIGGKIADEVSIGGRLVRLLARRPSSEEDAMQYVLLIYQGTTPTPATPEWSTLTEEEQQQIYADYGALNQAPGVTPGLAMGVPDDATTVRVQDGKPLVTDGPFAATKEAVGGYFILEADDLDAAIEVASRVPAARLGGAIEIRAVSRYW
jgi:hypothetical protein